MPPSSATPATPATRLCPVCGAPALSQAPCDFDRPADDSPAHGDYDAMHKGLMTHAEHLLVVARWALHNPQAHSPSVLARYRPVVREGWGKVQALHPLDGIG